MTTLSPIADLTGPAGADSTDANAIATLVDGPGPVADSVDARINAHGGGSDASGISRSPETLGDLLVADAFVRPDGPIVGTAALTGQKYTTSGVSPQDIADFTYAPSPAQGDASISYVSSGGISKVWEMHVFFNPNATLTDNLVIGSGQGSGFGDHAYGSVQLGVNRTRMYLFTVVDDGTGTGWIGGLDPITGTATEYNVQAVIEFDQPLNIDGTRYACKAFFNDNGYVTIVSHDGQQVTIRDEKIAKDLLGWFIGIQARSSAGTGFFGGIDYYSVYGVKPAARVASSLFRHDRTDQWATITMPKDHVDTGLDLTWEGSADDWSIDPAIQTFAHQTSGFTWSIRSDKPYLAITLDATGAAEASAAQFAPAWVDKERMAHRVTRDPVTGTVKFWTAPPLVSGESYVWTQLGADRTSTPGPIKNSKLPIRMADRVGSNHFFGETAYFAMKDGVGGGNLFPPLDLRGSKPIDPWYLSNPMFSVRQSSVSGLTTKLDALSVAVAAAHPITQRGYITPMLPPDASNAWDTITSTASCIGGGYRQTATSQGSPGSFVSWDIFCDQSTYAFEFLLRKQGTYGIVQASLDGVDIGGTFDGYGAVNANDNLYQITGVAIASAGTKRLSLRTVGKNASSSAYGAAVQVVQYRKTS